MPQQNAYALDHSRVPADFPEMCDSHPDERHMAWGICEELAVHLSRDCLEAKARAHRAERPVDILYMVYRRVSDYGWGEPAELRWVFRRVAALLAWPVPDAVKQL